MYLIEIDTLQLKGYVEGQIPPYAILSHRWGPEELNFKDVLKNRADKSSRGYQKLLGACQTAYSYHVSYIWIDTCCIDKKSSAELSEAINSMFSWYKNAEICLAYLEDVDCAKNDLDQSFMNSKWFTRAWTLQELLAPKTVDFFDSQWAEIGSRASRAKLIQAVTRIPLSALVQHGSQLQLQTWDVAEIMSWAAGREATRTEDIAYSLMGLFNVNMPLLYGEGDKAFIRLQEEIVRSSTDISILSWGFGHTKHQLLARHPAEFLNPQNNLDLPSRYLVHLLDTPLHLTSVGLNIELKLIRWQLNKYAVRVRTYLPRRQNFFRYLLLQRCWDWSTVYVVGTKDEEVQSTSPMISRTTLLTIRRDLSDAKRPDFQAAAFAECPKNGFIIETDREEFSINVFVGSPTPTITSENEAGVRWEQRYYGTTSDLYCNFSTARLPGVARFDITSNSGDPTLWGYAYFDFDSQPCVCMCHHSTEPKILPTSLQDIKHEEKHSSKRSPTEFRDNDSGLMCYFFSASIDSPCQCQIPGTSIWVGLRLPHESERWTLEFTLEEPAPIKAVIQYPRYQQAGW